MSLDSKSTRFTGAVSMAAVIFSLVAIAMVVVQVAFVGELHFSSIFLCGLLAGVVSGLLKYISEVVVDNDYDEMELSEFIESIFDEYPENVDFEDADSMLLTEPNKSLSAWGTPNPVLPVDDGAGMSPVLSAPVSLLVQKEIEAAVSRTLSNLPPLPANPPVIQLAETTDTASHTVVVEPPQVSELTPREVLESGPLREVIAGMENGEYIDALLYCLKLSKPGSSTIVLNAHGPVLGLGARGVRNNDGTTGFTRADVLKLLRKARRTVSANVQGDLQTSGEGQS